LGGKAVKRLLARIKAWFGDRALAWLIGVVLGKKR